MNALFRPSARKSGVLAIALLAASMLAPRAAAQEQVETYRYDAAGRITRVTYDGATTISYEYDENGNVTSENVTPNPPSGGGGGGGGSSGLCFIATAAYGSPLDPHVQALRDFRDAHLRTNPPGRAFVAFYERTSPPIAAFIVRHDAARALVRWGLAPLVFSVAYPWWALLVSSSLVAIWIAWRRIRRARRLALALRSAS